MRRVLTWFLLVAGGVLVLGGAGFLFSETRAALVAAGAGAIVAGLILIAAGIVLKPRRGRRRARDWRFAPTPGHGEPLRRERRR